MIAKNGQYVLTRYEIKTEEIDGIAIPEIHKSSNNFYRVIGFGLDNRNSGYVSLGDIVLCDNVSEIDNVMVGIDIHEFLLRREERIIAVIGHDENGLFPKEFHEPDIVHEIGKKFAASCHATCDRILIERDVVRGYRKHGGLLMPYSHREVGRSHTGTVISVGSKAEKSTGIKKGMRICYDYYAAYGHDQDFDIVDSLNVIAVLSKYDQQMMKVDQFL